MVRLKPLSACSDRQSLESLLKIIPASDRSLGQSLSGWLEKLTTLNHYDGTLPTNKLTSGQKSPAENGRSITPLRIKARRYEQVIRHGVRYEKMPDMEW